MCDWFTMSQRPGKIKYNTCIRPEKQQGIDDKKGIRSRMDLTRNIRQKTNKDKRKKERGIKQDRRTEENTKTRTGIDRARVKLA